MSIKRNAKRRALALVALVVMSAALAAGPAQAQWTPTSAAHEEEAARSVAYVPPGGDDKIR